MPYRVQTVFTDNGLHLTDPRSPGSAVDEIKRAMAAKELFRAHAFDHACAQLDIEHRLTKPKHPWTNGQVERMNRTIKDATVKRFHYDAHDQLRRHLADFVDAYNFARRLQETQRFGALQSYLQGMDKRRQKLQPRPTPSDAGTKQLALAVTGP